MTRRGLLFSFFAALGVCGLALALLTPWHPLGPGNVVVHPDVSAAFSANEIARIAGFRSALGVWPYVGIALTLATPWVVLAVVSRRAGNPQPAQPPQPSVSPKTGVHGVRRFGLILAVVVTTGVVQWAVGTPFSVHSELVLRRFGISTQGWPAWFGDQALALAMTSVVTGLGVALALWLVRRAPKRWPWLLATAAALVTVVGSLVYPLVVEPLFNAHTPLPQGPLGQHLERLAAADGFADITITVSNASIRTTGQNAHVSGFGATGWVVLDDTLVNRATTDPDAVISVVAHEMGHAKHQDVLRGTAIGAAGAAAFVLFLALVLTTTRGRRLFAPESDRSIDVVRCVALILAIAAAAPLAAAPVTNLVSRRIEASADVHALEVTNDVPAFIRSEHDLAMSNLTRLDSTWWQTTLFATHPDPAWRIAQARAWERTHQAG